MSTSGQKRIESTIDTAIDCDEDEVMELAMQAGELLLENGAEIFRVEETMDRICRHYGVESASQFILMNYILATAGEGHGHVFAKVRHIPVNGSHLDKVGSGESAFKRDRGRKIYGFRSLSGIGDDSVGCRTREKAC